MFLNNLYSAFSVVNTFTHIVFFDIEIKLRLFCYSLSSANGKYRDINSEVS